MKKVCLLVAALAALAAVSACASRPDNCVDFPGSRAAEILGDGATVKAWGAVKSRVYEAYDGSAVYYVAIRFHAAGHDGEATWLSHGLTSGLAESLDSTAEAWSGIPRSANFDSSDGQADEARRCIA